MVSIFGANSHASLLTEDGSQWIMVTSQVPVTTDWCTDQQISSHVAGKCAVLWWLRKLRSWTDLEVLSSGVVLMCR